jgi:hypothetical protein
MPTIIVPQARPVVPNVARTHWKVEVQARVIGAFADIAAHLAGVKFRLAAARPIDWDAPATDTILEVAPVAGPKTHRVWWECSPFATHVGVIIAYQARGGSSPPTIEGKLKKLDGSGIDSEGVLWSTANGGVAEASDFLRNGPWPTAVYRYPIQYTTTTGRAVAPAAIVGQTDPRLFNVGTEAGNPIMIEVVTTYARAHMLLGFEAIFPTITQ